jgi:hypothetical protein
MSLWTVVVEDSSTVSLILLEEETVERGIVALDMQNGLGPDGISQLILKKIVLVVKKQLAVLIYLSLLSKGFPCVWKESYVVSLFRGRDKRNISNYRGISILSAIPKLFVKLVCDVITPIIRPLISDEQHGFVGWAFYGD